MRSDGRCKSIRKLINRRNYPPTMKELGEALGISAASAHEHLNQLVDKGYVARERGKARSISILREPADQIPSLVSVPLVGVVKAGAPVVADENILGDVLVDEDIARRGKCFGLRVDGDSMVDAGIEDGDIVIVRRQPVAESGEIVVALVDDESTVKRLHIGGDHIELRPENRRYSPIVVGPEDDIRIVGKVVAVRRSGSSGG